MTEVRVQGCSVWRSQLFELVTFRSKFFNFFVYAPNKLLILLVEMGFEFT